jgi:6-methylsalicylic acid synthase
MPSNAKDGLEDDIAVIGMACRLPGNNDSPEKLWQSILDKKVASGPLPKVRWQAYHQRHPHNTKVRTPDFETEA